MKFSLVIPCYNEAASLPSLLERCKDIASRDDIEIILVDNGSTDDSPHVLQTLLPQYPRCRSLRIEKNQGYGFGILSGLRVATGEILGWTHADMQTDPHDTLRGLAFFEKYGTAIFVKGRRYGRPLSDTIFTIGMSFFETLLLRKPMWDINAQPNLFSRAFFETWQATAPHDFSLDLYAYYQAHCKKIKIFRFPVKFGERAYGVSHWNVNWSAKLKFIKRTIKYSIALTKQVKRPFC